MQLTGKHTFEATPAELWTLLMDAEVLARLVPGVSKLERTGENTYTSTLNIKLGPVSGSFHGNLELNDLAEPESFVLKVQQNSSIGNANAAVRINLEPVPDNKTEMAFDGDVKLSGILATMGQRVIGGATGTLSKQFFSNLESELERKRTTSS